MQHAADLLDVSRITIRRWIKRGFLKGYRVGPQQIRIPRSEIARLRSVRLPFIVECERPRYPVV